MATPETQAVRASRAAALTGFPAASYHAVDRGIAMRQDRYGLPVTTGSEAALAA